MVNFRLRYEKDTVVSLNHEKEKLYDVCNAEELQINKLKEVRPVASAVTMFFFCCSWLRSSTAVNSASTQTATTLWA